MYFSILGWLALLFLISACGAGGGTGMGIDPPETPTPEVIPPQTTEPDEETTETVTPPVGGGDGRSSSAGSPPSADEDSSRAPSLPPQALLQQVTTTPPPGATVISEFNDDVGSYADYGLWLNSFFDSDHFTVGTAKSGENWIEGFFVIDIEDGANGYAKAGNVDLTGASYSGKVAGYRRHENLENIDSNTNDVSSSFEDDVTYELVSGTIRLSIGQPTEEVFVFNNGNSLGGEWSVHISFGGGVAKYLDNMTGTVGTALNSGTTGLGGTTTRNGTLVTEVRGEFYVNKMDNTDRFFAGTAANYTNNFTGIWEAEN